jgi:hypothetical protein
MFKVLPASFVPDEDQGYFFVVVAGAGFRQPGVTRRFTRSRADPAQGSRGAGRRHV